MRPLLLTAAALALAGAAPAAPRDWTRTVAETPAGWRTGNPAAPVKLIEYGAMNCPHCAHFSRETDSAVMARVRSGRLSFEFRPYLIFPHDPAATLVARCVPLQRRFAFVRDYYAEHDSILARLRAALGTEAGQLAIDAGKAKGVGGTNQAYLKLSGMGPIAARYGLTAAAANRCVADPQGIAWLRRTQPAAKAAGVDQTPTYFLGSRKLAITQPDELLELLR